MSTVAENLPALSAATGGLAPSSFWSVAGFELVQRVARVYELSDMVPESYRGNRSHCVIACEIAMRMDLSPLVVMQHLYIVHGRPAWDTVFLIAAFNATGRFTTIRYAWTEDRTSCYGYCTERATGEVVTGPAVSLQTAKAEGWVDRKGSKWKTMPELMLSYRAAAFLIRLAAPEVALGLRTREEEQDIIEMPRAAAPLQAVRTILDREGVVPVSGASPAAEPPAVVEEAPAGVADTIAGNDEAPPSPAPRPVSGRASTSKAGLSRPGPPDARPPFDTDGYAQRIARCNDPAMLALLGEDISALPDSPERDRLYELAHEREDFLLKDVP